MTPMIRVMKGSNTIGTMMVIVVMMLLWLVLIAASHPHLLPLPPLTLFT